MHKGRTEVVGEALVWAKRKYTLAGLLQEITQVRIVDDNIRVALVPELNLTILRMGRARKMAGK